MLKRLTPTDYEKPTQNHKSSPDLEHEGDQWEGTVELGTLSTNDISGYLPSLTPVHT